MVTQVIMPKLAANIEEATIGQWLKAEGEAVAAGQLLFEAITDKAAVEVKAEGDGVLRRIYARENSVVPVGQVIAVIAEPDEPLPDLEPVRRKARPAPGRAVKASFGARRLAKELGLDIAAVTPSRPDGRITEEDIRRAAARAGGPAVLERIPLSPLKRALASHLTHTARSVAAAFMTLEADCTRLEAALPRLSDAAGTPILPRDVIVHLAARLLPEHRLLNACFTEEGILVYEPINVALAFDVERDDSVLVPVIREADRKSLPEIAREAASLVARIQAHDLGPDDLADATFTVTDQSRLGIDNFVPILHDKQSAIVAMSAIRPRPIVRGDAVGAAPMTNLAVAFDHRVLNGTTAAGFLHALKERLESFGGD
jgi:pyruvate dehydrogenase E2 component (dihydrolipoamide acetyltransferase)